MDTLKSQLNQILDCQPLWRLGLLVSMIAILFLATTSEPYPVPSSANDKINHLIAFAELAVLSRLAWPRINPLAFVPALLGFGLLIEGIQSQLPHREFSMADVAADGVGIAIGLLPWPGLKRQTQAEDRPQNQM
ncbi:MAG: VanZ family protein [Pseudomonadota bacterium]